MTMKLPKAKELTALLVFLKTTIGDEYRSDSDDSLPCMDVTVGCNPETGEWGYQTGDNSYSGGAYLYPLWGVVTLYRRSNSPKLARDIRSQIAEQVYP